MMKNSPINYTESAGPFFKLKSKARLAKLLFISKTKMKKFSKDEKKYYSFPKPKKDGGFRQINAPQDDLKAVQSRIAELLQRIAPPDFLFAPVKGKSYVDNAAHHVGARSIKLLDIMDFFPSCTSNKVIWFFRTRMECSDDISVIIKEIVTLDESLPQGSPCSPILAYLCYVDMWEEIGKIVSSYQCRLSVYADDITISGQITPEKMVWEIKKTLHRHGHQYNAEKERSRIDKPAQITGVILTNKGLKLPNKQHQKIYEIQNQLRMVQQSAKRQSLESQLRGRKAQKNQVLNASQST